MQNLTSKIFELTAPWDNPYQGTDKRLLFVCSAGLLRSATAANLFAKKGYNTRSCDSSNYALIPLSTNLVAWAHQIFFVNEENYKEALKSFQDSSWLRELMSKSEVLDIYDDFPYNSPKLIEKLEEQVVVS